jgi:ATP-dependent DNA helicase RecQ
MHFPELKPFQREALESLRKHPHTVLVAPTGSGKSLIFQKFLFENRQRTRSILISPLNALSRQIAEGLKSFEIPVALGTDRTGSGGPPKSGVWILSPEKLLGSAYAKAREWRPNLLVVDEAHCVWEWGEAFRPEFSKVPNVVRELAIPKTFWCSATLPVPAFQKISEAIPGPIQSLGKFSVPSALQIERLQVSPHQKLNLLRNLLSKNRTQSGMIFVSTRASAERLQAYLEFWNVRSVFYHAGMSVEERINLERALALHDASSPVWVVATSAFGMGMNYAFLQRCILFEPSLTLLSLAQAFGRVGRSNSNAQVTVLWHENDFRSLEAMMEARSERIRRLAEVKTWCATTACPKLTLENYFNAEGKSGTFET